MGISYTNGIIFYLTLFFPFMCNSNNFPIIFNRFIMFFNWYMCRATSILRIMLILYIIYIRIYTYCSGSYIILSRIFIMYMFMSLDIILVNAFIITIATLKHCFKKIKIYLYIFRFLPFLS